jgi:hypothetical protein
VHRFSLSLRLSFLFWTCALSYTFAASFLSDFSFRRSCLYFIRLLGLIGFIIELYNWLFNRSLSFLGTFSGNFAWLRRGVNWDDIFSPHCSFDWFLLSNNVHFLCCIFLRTASILSMDWLICDLLLRFLSFVDDYWRLILGLWLRRPNLICIWGHSLANNRSYGLLVFK